MADNDNAGAFELAPRGHNAPPPDAQAITDQMAAEHAALLANAEKQVDQAGEIAKEIIDEADHGRLTAMVVKLRDTHKNVNGTRVMAKAPFLRAEEAVDGVFNPTLHKLETAGKGLVALIRTWQLRKEAEERARRQREEAERRRIADEAAKKAAEEARIAEEARLAAERARKPEKVALKAEIAGIAEVTADEARVDSMMADDSLHVAKVAAAQKPAELARERFSDGRVSTLKLVGYVEITDRDQLDAKALLPFFKEKEILSALRAWAKCDDFTKSMPGAIVDKRPDVDIR